MKRPWTKTRREPKTRHLAREVPDKVWGGMAVVLLILCALGSVNDMGTPTNIELIVMFFPLLIVAMAIIIAVAIASWLGQWTKRCSLGVLIVAVVIAYYPASALTARWAFAYGVSTSRLVGACGLGRGLAVAWDIHRGVYDDASNSLEIGGGFDYSVSDLCHK